MEQLSFEHMLDIIIQTLNRLDVRLTGHGERVAFGMLHLLEQDPRFPYEEVCKITLTSLLHDIGSFQHTTNIEDLLWLEQADGFSHARYGYAFLKHFSPFPGYAPSCASITPPGSRFRIRCWMSVCNGWPAVYRYWIPSTYTASTIPAPLHPPFRIF